MALATWWKSVGGSEQWGHFGRIVAVLPLAATTSLISLLYPPQGNKGPNRVATVLSQQTLTQQRLAQELGLGRFCSTQLR
jgi:hypothetical protein